MARKACSGTHGRRPGPAGPHCGGLAGAASASDDAQCTQTVSVQPSSSYTLTGWVQGSYVFLGDTGTASSLPDLKRFGLNPKFVNAPINVHNVVSQAIIEIEARLRAAAEAKAAKENPNAGQ